MPVKKKSAKPVKKSSEKVIGKVVHWYNKISVAIIELKGALKVGDKIRVKTLEDSEKKIKTNFLQDIKSMQVNYKPVKTAGKGDAVGLKVNKEAQEGDIVYKIA